MTTKREIYRCPICGNIVEVLHPGAVLSCCGKPMILLNGSAKEGAKEKHVPEVTKVEGGYHLKISSVEHPMTEDHFIWWVELLTATEVLRKEFKPGERPEVLFLTKSPAVSARAYCNLHGLWINECSHS